MAPKVVCALASPIGKSAALIAKTDAQASAEFRIEVIAPSPRCVDLSLGKSFHGSACGTSAHTAWLRAVDRFLGDVLLKHQFAPHRITDPGNLHSGRAHKVLIVAICR
jgi:hypothetical protein